MCETPNNEIKVTSEDILAKLEALCKPDEKAVISSSLVRSKFPNQEISSSSIYSAITDLRKKFEANQNKLDQINQKIKGLEEEVKKESKEELQSKQPKTPARDEQGLPGFN